LRFLAHVERIGSVHLHPVGEFKGLDARFELRVACAPSLVLGVELLEQVELLALLLRRHRGTTNVLDQLLNIGVFRIEVSPLINSRQKAGLPVL
jgi:hypothetical protein